MLRIWSILPVCAIGVVCGLAASLSGRFVAIALPAFPEGPFVPVSVQSGPCLAFRTSLMVWTLAAKTGQIRMLYSLPSSDTDRIADASLHSCSNGAILTMRGRLLFIHEEQAPIAMDIVPAGREEAVEMVAVQMLTEESAVAGVHDLIPTREELPRQLVDSDEQGKMVMRRARLLLVRKERSPHAITPLPVGSARGVAGLAAMDRDTVLVQDLLGQISTVAISRFAVEQVPVSGFVAEALETKACQVTADDLRFHLLPNRTVEFALGRCSWFGAIVSGKVERITPVFSDEGTLALCGGTARGSEVVIAGPVNRVRAIENGKVLAIPAGYTLRGCSTSSGGLLALACDNARSRCVAIL